MLDLTDKPALAPKARTIVCLAIILCLVYGMYALRQYKPFTFAVADPGWSISTVMSIVEDRDFDLRNQLKHDPFQAADQTAQGKNGEWYPLHEIVMPIFTVPFYLVFGIEGCLIFNVLSSILLMIVVFQLCERHVDRHSAFTAVILTAFSTLFLSYTYSYSLDVFGTLLLTIAYSSVVKRRFFLGGFVWGLAAFARFSTITTFWGFAIYTLIVRHPPVSQSDNSSVSRGRHGKALIMFMMGALPCGLCILFTNWTMFGSATTTSYDRWQHFINGTAIVTSQRGAFGCSPIDTLPALLMDPKSGLIVGAPILIIAIAFGLRRFWQKDPKECTLLLLTCGSLLLLFSLYCNAMPGIPGNRYLMPLVALCAIPLGFAIESVFRDSIDVSRPKPNYDK